MMKVVSKRAETKQERIARFKADKKLAAMNMQIAHIDHLVAELQASAGKVVAERDVYIREMYPDLQDEFTNLLTGSNQTS